jgi:glycosyltransferase involved in cell wall biosynthesis
MINNWINEKEIYPLESNNPRVVEFKRKYGIEDKFIVMYSGNIGLYYDLEGLIRVVKKFKNTKTEDGREVVFAFVGAGSILDKLLQYKDAHGLDNVIFIPYQDKDKLIYSLNSADVHWCVNAKGIKGVSCPSKFYGIAGVGKPVLGVLEKGSEVEMLITEIGCGKVSEPGDYQAVEENINWFISHADSGELADMGKRGHEYLVKNLTKNVSVKKYIDAIERS